MCGFGTTAADAGAASGVVNTFHQVGSSLGLGILVATASVAGAAVHQASAVSRLAIEVSAALTAGSILLGLDLIITLALIVLSAIAAQATRKTSNADPTDRCGSMS